MSHTNTHTYRLGGHREGTRSLGHLSHSGSRTLKNTQALGQSSTRELGHLDPRGTLFSSTI